MRQVIAEANAAFRLRAPSTSTDVASFSSTKLITARRTQLLSSHRQIIAAVLRGKSCLCIDKFVVAIDVARSRGGGAVGDEARKSLRLLGLGKRQWRKQNLNNI